MASMLQSLLTEKPKVPAFKPIDFGQIQSEATQQDINLLPKLGELTGKFNQMSGDEMNAALERALPGYKNLRDTTTANISSLERGEIPQDVQEQLARRAAEQGIALGTSGSQFGQYSALRNLGLTSLQLSTEGLSAANAWINAAAARTPTFNFGSMFINPTQRAGLREAEAQFKWNVDWLHNKVAAIPSGWKAALITLANNVEQIGRSVLSSYAGGAMGGGGGAAGAAGGAGGGGGGNSGGGGGGGTLNAASEGLGSWAEY